jgi:hypothetical protein
MLEDKWKERIRRAARLLLYVIGVLYLVGLYGTITNIESGIRSMESNIDSIESDVTSIQDDVSSIQDDVSSIRDDVESSESAFMPRSVARRRGSPQNLSPTFKREVPSARGPRLPKRLSRTSSYHGAGE